MTFAKLDIDLHPPSVAELNSYITTELTSIWVINTQKNYALKLYKIWFQL